MHLTFVNSDGLEAHALAFSSSKSVKMAENLGDYDSDSELVVVDENSPLLLDLDPPGTKTSYMGEIYGRKANGEFQKRNQRLPLVIVITAIGMAAMVLVGFMTMFQDTAETDFTHNDITNDSISITNLNMSTNSSIIRNSKVKIKSHNDSLIT